MAHTIKKLPIGIQSLRKMIEGKYTYVDKTKIILQLIQEGECYFLSRPRRFGKSLLLSTLQEIFKGNKELFKGLHIYSSDYQWHEHPIIHLSFTSMNTSSAQHLERDIEYRLSELALEHDIDITSAPSLQTKFTTLIKKLAIQNRVVLLVDEYDFPLINNMDSLEIADACRKVLHDFFVVLKDLDDYLRFILVTGVTKFSKTSIFSGLNNLDDLTLTPKAALLLGYTHNELQQNFGSYLNSWASKKNITSDQLIEQMKEWYDGYQFAEGGDGDTLRMYNPYSVLSFLAHGTLYNY